MSKTKAAGIFLLNSKGEILVCHPTNHKPDFWSIPKGKIDGDETPLAAAIRETLEESNVDVSTYKLVRALEPVNYGHKQKVIHPFIIWEIGNPHLGWDKFELKCNSNVPEERGGFPEMDDFKWVTIPEARTILHETQVACLDAIESFMRSCEYFTVDC